MKALSKQKSFRSRAMALVVVLSFVVFLSLIVVALVVAMRLERQAAHFYSEKVGADFFAYEGVEMVKAGIRSQTTGTNRIWISMPGRIMAWTNGLSEPAVVTELFSGTAAGDDSCNLNRRSVSGDFLTTITGEATEILPMNVGWIYVFEDGVRSTELAHQSVSRVIGRFAYWADDESARVDLNTAWKQAGNTNLAGDLSRVSLLAIPSLFEADADAIHDQARQMPFNSPDEARRLSASLAEILSTNRFLVGYRSIAPDLNPWGQPKLFLTTQKANIRDGNTNTFLDILTADNIDPGQIANVSAAKFNTVANRILTAMARRDWPYSPGVSFIDKYGERKAAQIALNIIEYVRSVESTNIIVEPVRATYAGGKLSFQSSGNELIGNTRRPLMSEVGVWVPPTRSRVSGGNHEYDIKYFLEFYLPPNGGIDRLDLADLCVYLTPPYTRNKEYKLPNLIISKGQYGVVSVTERYSVPSTSPRPSEIRVRYTVSPSFYLPANTPKRLDLVPMAAEGEDHGRLSFQIDPPTVSTNDIHSWSIDDIYANKNIQNWRWGRNTFGSANTYTSVGTPSTATPEQDTGPSGSIVSDGPRFPNAKGTGNNLVGKVQSLRELGSIHSGSEGYLRDEPSVPWRTIRLQPQGSSTAALPDWALLELFRIPLSDPLNALSDVVHGRVNLNASVNPFTNVARPDSLRSLLLGDTNIPGASHEMVLQNIRDLSRASRGKSYASTNGLVSPGELAELAGVSDQGELSENQLMGLIDRAGVKGNVFRVFSVGQSIDQMASGKLVVQAEKFVLAIVERTVDPVTGGVNCRVIGWRTLPL